MMTRGARILMYHRVGIRDGSFMDEYTVSPVAFAQQMHTLKADGWTVIPLADALQGGKNSWKEPTVTLTFDDGFASNQEHAWPVLTHHHFPSATFVVTDHLGTVNHWDGPSRAVYPLLSATDLLDADPTLMSFYPHSATHADLTTAADDHVLERELVASRTTVESLLGGRADVFAYPWGSWNWRVVQGLQETGYRAACTTMEGLNGARTDRWLLRRINVVERDIGWRFRLKLRTGRDLTVWPLQRPPEISILAARFKRWRFREGTSRNATL